MKDGDKKYERPKGHSRYYVWGTCPDCGLSRWIWCSSRREQEDKKSFVCLRCNGARSGIQRRKHPYGYTDSNGYRIVRVDLDSPFSSMVSPCLRRMHIGYVLEHRLVVARHLGRPLEKHEIVHHLNGIKDDNNAENLVLTNAQNHDKRTFIRQLQERIRILEGGINVNS